MAKSDEDLIKQFPNIPTVEVPANSTSSPEELQKLKDLHDKKGGEVKIEEPKKNDTKKALVTVEPIKNQTTAQVKPEAKNETKAQVSPKNETKPSLAVPQNSTTTLVKRNETAKALAEPANN